MNLSPPHPVESPSSYSFRLKDIILGAQMLFIAFGALVLVPILAGLDPNVALFTAGVGTLVFQLITKGKVPVFWLLPLPLLRRLPLVSNNLVWLQRCPGWSRLVSCTCF